MVARRIAQLIISTIRVAASAVWYTLYGPDSHSQTRYK